jgi:hypothetical protein
MSQFSPIWNVELNGVSITDSVLASMSITSGRTNIYEQAVAGYCNLTLLNLNQTLISANINDSITVELKNSSGVFVPIFGGTLTDIGVEVAQVGEIGYTQRVTLVALGALSRLPKKLVDGVLSKDFDGDQIYEVLSNLLLAEWNEVPTALQWQNVDPAMQWNDAFNLGLGEIDRPGDYELAARSSSRTDAYSLVRALATSGLGYLYENSSGQISYADASHRAQYLAANGYVELTANHAQAGGLAIKTRAGDIRNSVTVKYNATSSAEESASDAESIALFGELGQIISTTLHNSADAQSQADFYLTLRAYPQAAFTNITYQLTNSEIDDSDRNNLIAMFMGMPVSISDLPLNMVSGTFLGFVEGWTFRAAYNEVSISLNLSPLAFSLQAMKWQDVNIAELWNTIDPTMTWAEALVVA